MADLNSRTLAGPARSKPKLKVRKHQIDPIKVASEAARAGDARFQYFVETGKLRHSK